MTIRSTLRSWWYGSTPDSSPPPPDTTSPPPPLGAEPPHPYDVHEQPLPLALKLLLVLLPLLLLRIAILVLAFLLFVLACFLFQSSPAALHFLLPLIARFALVGFGVWPGLISIEGKPPRVFAPIYLSAPHVGLLDAWLWIYLGPARPMMMEAYTKIPVVSTVFRATRGIVVTKRTESAGWLAGKDGGNSVDASSKAKAAAESAKRAIAQHKEVFDIEAPHEMPLLICPEGHTHSGNSLLHFFPGAFEGGTTLQPVVVVYPYKYFNAAAFVTTLTSHVLRIMMSPYIRIVVKYLPVRRPTEAEASDAKMYASNVRKEMAAVAGLPLSKYNARELREEEQEQKRSQKARLEAAKVLV